MENSIGMPRSDRREAELFVISRTTIYTFRVTSNT